MESGCDEANSVLPATSTPNHCAVVVKVTEYLFAEPYAGHVTSAPQEPPPDRGVGPELVAVGVGVAADAVAVGVTVAGDAVLDGVGVGGTGVGVALLDGVTVGVFVGFGFVDVLFTGLLLYVGKHCPVDVLVK